MNVEATIKERRRNWESETVETMRYDEEVDEVKQECGNGGGRRGRQGGLPAPFNCLTCFSLVAPVSPFED